MADDFNNTCAFHYKDIEVADQLIAAGINKECCFIFKLEVGETTICNAKPYHCIYDTLVLLKTMKEGCKNAGTDGLELPEGD